MLVYRDFTRIGGGKVPDAKTMGRWGVAVGPAVVETLHRRLIAIAQQQHLVEGRKMDVSVAMAVPPVNGRRPVAIWNTMIPIENRSDR